MNKLFKRFLVFVIFAISLSAMVWAVDLAPHLYSISLEVKVDLPSEEGKFMGFFSLLERRMSEIGAITSLSTDKNRVDFVLNTRLSSERIKYILSKSGMFSVKEQARKKTDMEIKYAYCDFEADFSPELNITLSKESGEAFAKITEENIDKKLPCFLDEELLLEPVVRKKISHVRLVLTYCSEDPGYYAGDLAVILRNGPLNSEVSIT